jgi:thioredoxin reductase (NADPH)
MNSDSTHPGPLTRDTGAGADEHHRPVIVLGSGPAGLTAAIYAARAELRPLVIAGVRPLGQVALSAEIEDFPGFPEPVPGSELMERMRAQAERFGATVVDQDATGVALAQRPFGVSTSDGDYRADALIVATGAAPVRLGIRSEEEFRGRGVSDCAACDGFFFRNRHVAVVGGGDAALEEATVLTRFAEAVTLIVPGPEIRGSKTIERRLLADPKLAVRWNAEVTDVVGNGTVGGVMVRDLGTGETSRLDVQGLFVAMGYRPSTAALEDQLQVSEAGYLRPRRADGASIEGVFLAGDVHDHRYRQAVVAAADGCRAAIDAERWLASVQLAKIATPTNW